MADDLDDDSPEAQHALRLAREAQDLILSLIAARKRQGLLRREVAERAGLAEDQVRDFERLGANPTLSMVKRYARAVGVDLQLRVDASGLHPSRSDVVAWGVREPVNGTVETFSDEETAETEARIVDGDLVHLVELGADQIVIDRGLVDRLTAALLLLMHDAHPVYANTTGWHGGIGGAAMTPGCSVIDPPPDAMWTQMQMPAEPARAYLEQFPFDFEAVKEQLKDEWTKGLGL